MAPILSVKGLNKTYKTGFSALKSVDLDVEEGEILALLGPNGAGKTTLISIICGIVTATSGSVMVAGHDIQVGYRASRDLIGLVPQELALDIFNSPWKTVQFSRGLFGKAPDDGYLLKLLEQLSLKDKKDSRIMALSGGMKRRVAIAKALSHEPRILFLDEPTAGVDVELRKEMWEIVRELRKNGVTIILTTHYIEEAEEMADRIAVINHGEIILVEEKAELMRKLGKKHLRLELTEPLAALPGTLADRGLSIADEGRALVYEYDTRAGRTGITQLLGEISAAGIHFADLETQQSTLEEIFVDLVGENQ
ncbi:MAG: ABC transporter ATP-binding protein [Hyphomicrobiaceae bacterium]|nr:ABC transporter ATP-binding protein [Hyphomicrobiaceae bacterium]